VWTCARFTRGIMYQGKHVYPTNLRPLLFTSLAPGSRPISPSPGIIVSSPTHQHRFSMKDLHRPSSSIQFAILTRRLNLSATSTVLHGDCLMSETSFGQSLRFGQLVHQSSHLRLIKQLKSVFDTFNWVSPIRLDGPSKLCH